MLIIVAAFVVIVILGGAAIFYLATSKKKKKPLSLALRAIPMVLFLAALAVVIYALLDLQTLGATIVDSGGLEFYTGGNDIILLGLLFVPAFVVLITAFILLSYKFPSFSFTTKDIAFAGVLLGLAAALSFIRIFRMPQAGSVTLASTLAIMIFCYYFGFRKGAVVVMAFLGFRFARGDMFILHAWSLLLDYIIPFSTLIFFGVFSYRRNNTIVRAPRGFALKPHINFFVGFALYVIVRYFSKVLSGILFFGEWAPIGHTVVGWAFLYNTFFLVDAAIALVGGVVLLSSKQFNRFMASSSNTLQNANSAHENNETTSATTNEREWETSGRNGTGDNGNIYKGLNSNNSSNATSEIATESIGSILSDTDSTSN